MAKLEISLLGPFQVVLDDKVMTHFRADSMRALLAYLVMQPGTPFRREELAGLLWPEKPESVALHNLRQALNLLRKQGLGDKNVAVPFLEITRKHLLFNPESDYWLDVTQFTGQITLLKEKRGYRLWCGSDRIKELQKAAELYRGDFLSGFSLASSISFEQWMVVKRQQFHHQALEILNTLAISYERCEEYVQAKAVAQRQIALEPWREQAHRQLMRALALNGQRNAALMQYQKCKAIVAEELAVEPEEKTKRLYQQIKASQRLHSRDSYMRSMPPVHTSFIGREDELAELVRYLINPANRLLTLVGKGGIGKTRLALAAAQQVAVGFAEGCCFVSLAEMAVDGREASENRLALAIANALQLSCREDGNPKSQVLAFLRDKDCLLLLDSFETVADVEFIIELLQRAPQVVMLITSRQRLNLQAESVMPITGLAVPASDDLFNQSSVALFCERAKQTWPKLTLDTHYLGEVVRLCSLVQGSPLAIELAASWVEHFTIAEIVNAIEEDLDFLATTRQDIPPRHRSMRAVFEQSWQLLNKAQRQVFTKLCVFEGSFDRKSANAVAGASIFVLSSLINNSFIKGGTGARYEIDNLLKQYGTDKLAAFPEEDWSYDIRELGYL